MPKPIRRKTDKVYIGIDPGKSGGLVAIQATSLGSIVVTPMPATERDVWDWFAAIPSEGSFAVIEKVHSMPKQGVASSFTFGQGYGFLRCCLIASELPFEDVIPRNWQKALGIRPRKKTESNHQWKNFLRGKAQQLFPNIAQEITLLTADALLIAEYCRREHKER